MTETEINLPSTIIKRIVKAKLAELAAGEDGKQKDVNLSKDALLAFGESAKVFISYITAMSNDICHESKRQTISAEDVFKALAEMDFEELVEPLKEALQAFKKSAQEKNAKKAEAKKRKVDEEADREKQGEQDQQQPAGDALPNEEEEQQADDAAGQQDQGDGERQQQPEAMDEDAAGAGGAGC